MRYDLKYKIWPIGSQGVWKHGSLKELLLDIPHFRLARNEGTLPPLTEMNAVLTQGKSDAGMSGFCEWLPFQLSEVEYQEVVLELLTEPGTNFRQSIVIGGAV